MDLEKKVSLEELGKKLKTTTSLDAKVKELAMKVLEALIEDSESENAEPELSINKDLMRQNSTVRLVYEPVEKYPGRLPDFNIFVRSEDKDTFVGTLKSMFFAASMLENNNEYVKYTDKKGNAVLAVPTNVHINFLNELLVIYKHRYSAE